MEKVFLSLNYSSEEKLFDLDVYKELEKQCGNLTEYQLILLETLSLSRVQYVCKKFGEFETFKNVGVIVNTINQLIDIIENLSFDVNKKYNFDVSIKKMFKLYDICLEEDISILEYLPVLSIAEIIESFLALLNILSKGSFGIEEMVRSNLPDLKIFCKGIYLPSRVITLYYDQKYYDNIYQNPRLLICEYERIESDYKMITRENFDINEYIKKIKQYRNLNILN